MIFFKDWVIWSDGKITAQQFDHLTRSLTVTGALPREWEWVMLVSSGNDMDILPMEWVDGGVGIQLTAQQLSRSGSYRMQLRGTKGEQVRHTNMISAYIAPSLSGDVHWPEIPGVFSDLERRVTQKAQQAESYASHPPIIGDNGNWWGWDGTGYVDTGMSCRGETGPAYQLTVSDKQELVDAILAALPNGDEVSY